MLRISRFVAVLPVLAALAGHSSVLAQDRHLEKLSLESYLDMESVSNPRISPDGGEIVGNVTTPTMLMTGEQDLRTPMPETEEYYAALKSWACPPP
jgi:hypothetical protein